ncbi:hypothetical protein Rrhod_3030 [Rhodococcus rhodnii LMG 5362]|uniref:Uncharacterized protein n=2 Tax=Rhodococcus rhodnii TaxID=38312 RepID=R7WJW2_9NOCA|nr:hypothetical protein Rrhod_3030 [Rhodococcus rhodnii LMG 5362]
MEEVAQGIQSNPGESLENVTIGGLYFSSVSLESDGCVYFVDREWFPISTYGWMYGPNCTPDPNKFGRLRMLGGEWYEFERGT